jgi:hypothetical protein
VEWTKTLDAVMQQVDFDTVIPGAGFEKGRFTDLSQQCGETADAGGRDDDGIEVARSAPGRV